MNVKHLPISVRSRCSKFTLMKKDTKDSKVQFFKQGTTLQFQADLHSRVKTRQNSKNQTQSIQKEKSMAMPRRGQENESSKEKVVVKASLNSQLMKLFKQLDSIKKKNVVSTNRTTYYDKTIEKAGKTVKKHNESLKDESAYPLHYQQYLNGNTISSHNNSINTITVKAKSRPQKKFKPFKQQTQHKQMEKQAYHNNSKGMANGNITLQPQSKNHFRRESNEMKDKEEDKHKATKVLHNNMVKSKDSTSLRLNITTAPISHKDRIKDKVINTFHPFHIGYMKPSKPNQSLRQVPNQSNNKHNKFMYLSTNQSHNNNANAHVNPNTNAEAEADPHAEMNPPSKKINRTIEPLYSMRPLSNGTDLKYINTTNDNEEEFNCSDHPYKSDSEDAGFIHDSIDSDEDNENSGVLAYDDVRDIIIYNDFEDVDKNETTLFETKTYDDYITGNKERILGRFFDNSARDNARMSPSTNESSCNKKNYVHVIKHGD